MEKRWGSQKLTQLLRRYKYPLAVLVVGLALMLLPSGPEKTPEIAAETDQQERSLEDTLEEILSQIEGAGQVRVLLTQRTGPETVYYADSQTDTDGDSASRSDSAVIVEHADREESALVRKTIGPEYLGAIVVCQGADDPKVRLAVVEAVRCVTGLGADQISVQNMK